MLEGFSAVLVLCVGHGLVLRRRNVKQFAGAGEVFGAAAIGKKAIMADAMEARGHLG